MIRKFIALFFVFTFYSANAYSSSPIKWGELASINSELIENRARSYLLLKKPELKNVAVKFIQLNIQIHENEGAWLRVVFLHANSFKPIEQSTLLKSNKDKLESKYYMEFISIEFSSEGEPIKLNLKEVLLGVEKNASEKQFWDTYNSF